MPIKHNTTHINSAMMTREEGGICQNKNGVLGEGKKCYNSLLVDISMSCP